MGTGAKGVLEFGVGLGIVLGLFEAGVGLHRLGFPLPGGVLGLLLLFVALLSGALKLAWVERAADLLLRHMVLLFVPLTVGLVEMGKVISRQAGAIVASLLVSFLAVLLTTGWLGRWLLNEQAGQ